MITHRSFPRSAVPGRVSLGCILVSLAGCANSREVQVVEQSLSDVLSPALTDTVTNATVPGLEHERLQALVGNWKAVTRAWRFPGARVEQGKGTMSNFWMLDGRFVGQEYKSRAQRPKYQGLGALGYDNIKNVYTSVWLDTMSTSILTATGSCDESGNVFTLEGVYQDPEAGKPARWRSITRIVNKKKYTFELFKQGSDGKEFKGLDITYTRK